MRFRAGVCYTAAAFGLGSAAAVLLARRPGSDLHDNHYCMKLTPDYSLFVILAIFFLTYLVVRRFFLTPVNRILVERDAEYRTAEELYEAALARFREATTAMESKLQEARREGSRLRDRFRSEAAVHRADVLQKTNSQADVIVEEADARLKNDVAEARLKIVTESESLARLAAERILGRAV